MNKKVFLVGLICLVLIIGGTIWYYTSDVTKLMRDGYRIDWDDPWLFDNCIYYFCEYKNQDGELIQGWMTERECHRVIEAKHKGTL